MDVSYVTTDGSDITYRIRLSPSVADPTSARAEVHYPDGSMTVMTGYAGTNPGGGTSVLYTRLYATAMIDRNGNVTTIEYEPPDPIAQWLRSGPRAVRLVDPLGREVRFHYLFGRYLTAITATAAEGAERVLARLTYRSVEAYYAIDASDPAKDKFCYAGYFLLGDPNHPVGGPSVSGWRPCSADPNQHRWGVNVLQGIFFPGTGTGYWFGDADSYNRYGMLTKVVEQAQMAHSAPSLTEPGTLTPGTTIRTRTYDFPQGPPATGDRQAFPRFETLTETFSGMAAPLITRYEVAEQPMAETVVTVTLPDGSRRITSFDPNSGLPSKRTMLGPDGAAASEEEYVWVVGTDGVSRLARLTETDPLGRKNRTEYTFNAKGRLQDVKRRDWVEASQIGGAPLLRWLRYEYLDDPAYAQRGIRGLVRRVETYGPSSLLPEERTDYEYDGLPLAPTPGVGRNVFLTPGFRPDLLALMPPDPGARRGLVSRTLRWVAPQVPAATGTIATESFYNQAGALTEVRVAGRTRFTIGYLPATQYALPDTVTLGAFVSAGASTTSVSRLTWDVGTGELLSLRRPSRGVVRFGYDGAARLVRVVQPGRYDVRREFSATGLAYTDTARDAGDVVVATAVTEVDGTGQTRRILDTPTGSPTTESLFEYDGRARLVRFARGPAPLAHPIWSTLQYDGTGRIERTVTPDASVSTSRYGRTGVPPELLATGTARQDSDPWGRTRHLVTDALGRTVQVLEPRNAGTGWTATLYAYDARSNLVSIYSDANRSGTAVAGRRFQYDGLSRLTHRYLIERSPALGADGRLASPGLWSDVYRYNAQSQLTEHVDARGVLVSYDYRADALGRLFSIRVTPPTSSSGAATIYPMPDTRFSYMRSGDPMRLRSVKAAGLYEEVYRYDPRSRLDEIITTFADRPSTPVRQRVTRDADGRVDLLAVGTPAEAELKIGYLHDAGGRRYAVKGGPTLGGWSVTAGFDPPDTLKQLSYKQAGWEATETFDLDAALGRFSRQRLAVTGTSVLDDVFYYDDSTRPRLFGESSLDTSAAGQLVAVKDNVSGRLHEYVYDGLSRLIRASSAPTGAPTVEASGYEYSYDGAGNRTAARGMGYDERIALPSTPGEPTYPPDQTPPGVDGGPAAADGQHDLAVDGLTNRITSPGFDYDAAGNTVRLPRKDGSILLLDYDGLGRLRRVRQGGTADGETYRYNHQGQMIVLRRADGSSRYSVWHGAASPTHFEAASPSAPMRHAETPVTLHGRLVARVLGPSSSAAPEFLHDTRGGWAATVPGSGTLGRPADLAPYGFDASGAVSVSLTSKYHSYARSRFGIDYAINRHYDAETGRFLQTDPLGQGSYRLEDPQSLNLYAFTRGDPINRRDPLGLDDCDAGGLAEHLPDGGLACRYPYGRTVYETVINAQQGDGFAILSAWGPAPGWSPWQLSDLKSDDQQVQDVIDRALAKKLRQLREKQQRCGQARASFAAAASAYARAGANIAVHNLQVEALQFAAAQTAADMAENVMEQTEDFSVPQAGAAAAGRMASAMSLKKQHDAAQINKALLQADQAGAVATMKAAAEARDAACK